MTKQIPYGELKVGQFAHIQGHRFEVIEVSHLPLQFDGVNGDIDARQPAGTVVVRFTGKLGNDDELARTAYDGGCYGGYSWVPVTVEVEDGFRQWAESKLGNQLQS